jgi:AcrR family transcriptional regulator
MAVELTSERIKMTALKHFAQFGYEGASMANIAEEVGIKKQSIYTHFKGKDELLLEVSDDVLVDELKFLDDYAETHRESRLEDFLYGFLLKYRDRYGDDDFTKFLLRMLFFQPAHLSKEAEEFGRKYVDHLEEILIPVAEKGMEEGQIERDVGARRAAVAYMGVLDGLFFELLTGDESRVQEKLDFSWHVFWRGVSSQRSRT